MFGELCCVVVPVIDSNLRNQGCAPAIGNSDLSPFFGSFLLLTPPVFFLSNEVYTDKIVTVVLSEWLQGAFINLLVETSKGK